MMSLTRQHSKKGSFVSSYAGVLERDFGKASCVIYTDIVEETDYRAK